MILLSARVGVVVMEDDCLVGSPLPPFLDDAKTTILVARATEKDAISRKMSRVKRRFHYHPP
jgi:hypothetical protein